MASCVTNILTKNYKNLRIGFQVTFENVGNVFWETVYIVLQLTVRVCVAGHFCCSSNVTSSSSPRASLTSSWSTALHSVRALL